MIPLYILGILQRFGPQHGYQIKKTIAEQLSDFTQIKLPTIYYHLEKMQKEGLLTINNEKTESMHEITVYSITDKGVEAFHKKLTKLLEFNYRPTFPADGAFYFSEYLESGIIAKNLKIYIEKLNKIISHIEKHRDETLQFVPAEFRTTTDIIFSHHLMHYKAELNWAVESINKLNLKEDL